MSVLVIEGYGDLRIAILSTLSRAHYSCVGVSSPEEAIDTLQKNSFSAIVLDPRNEDDPVIHFLEQQQPGELAKLLLLGDDAEEGAGGYPMLRKPFSQADLVARLSPAPLH